jgi:hypothetical protein
MKKSRRYTLYFLVALALLFAMLWYTIQHREMRMVVTYQFFDYENPVKQDCNLVLEVAGKEYIIEPELPMDECYAAAWFQIEYPIPDELSKIDKFTLELQHNEDTAEIKSITFMTCNTQVAKYSSFDISKLFTTSGQVADIGYEMLSIDSDEDEIYLYGTDTFIGEYNTYYGLYWRAVQNCIFWAIVFMILLIIIDYCISKRKRIQKPSLEEYSQ